MSHVVLLVQPKTPPATRTYCYFQNVKECAEGICRIYEEHLKRHNPNKQTITYDISQLFDFIDEFDDISCLVYSKSTKMYAAHGVQWIKEKIYTFLQKAAFIANVEKNLVD